MTVNSSDKQLHLDEYKVCLTKEELELLGTEDKYSKAPADTSFKDSPIRSPVLILIYNTQQNLA